MIFDRFDARVIIIFGDHCFQNVVAVEVRGYGVIETYAVRYFHKVSNENIRNTDWIGNDFIIVAKHDISIALILIGQKWFNSGPKTLIFRSTFASLSKIFALRR